MSYAYIKGKAYETAKAVTRAHNIDFDTAYLMTRAVWQEAGRCILGAAGTQGWQRLSFREKSHICGEVVKSLLDRNRVAGFVSGERKSLV